MTENKRFIHKKWLDDRQLFDGDEPFAIVDVYIQAEAICEKLNELHEENKELKASLYAEKTNTAEVVNDYAKQFKRHSAQFSFMMDLAEDLGVDIKKLEALDD